MGGAFKPFAGFGYDAMFPHQSGDTLPGASDALLAEGMADAWTSIGLVAFLVNATDLGKQCLIFVISKAFSMFQPAVKSAPGY